MSHQEASVETIKLMKRLVFIDIFSPGRCNFRDN